MPVPPIPESTPENNAYHTRLKLCTDADRTLRILGVAVRGRDDAEGALPERGVPVQSRRVLECGAAAHAPPVRVDHCLVSLVFGDEATVGWCVENIQTLLVEEVVHMLTAVCARRMLES